MIAELPQSLEQCFWKKIHCSTGPFGSNSNSIQNICKKIHTNIDFRVGFFAIMFCYKRNLINLMNFLHFFNIFFVVKSFDVGKIMALVFFPKCYMKVVLGIHAVEKKVYAAREMVIGFYVHTFLSALPVHYSCIGLAFIMNRAFFSYS